MDKQVHNELTAGLMDLTAMMEYVLATVTHYRDECIAAGFSPTMAEMMAGEFHDHLIRGAFDR